MLISRCLKSIKRILREGMRERRSRKVRKLKREQREEWNCKREKKIFSISTVLREQKVRE